ncbi:sarcolemmal membrane-associated protein [Cylas formicarius]|uniref:sarcolemmal membrane-associated protein n=1 Tax=Cylas formicarius TaxID=197179 RepID=UPI002958AB16|nr:sarcolemmal membrane-associated protein [Cylas formicarius]XP_060522008.1 sarcolemmal membrane-associated protein [Cylas formicarius]
MVVVSGSWFKKNVAPYSPNEDVTVVDEDATMAAKAVLICRPNSHHFQVRTLTLDQPIKVGRSVARAKPTSTNAVFDCKVLSRNHAVLWYENGKFYLQDTQSSNGTFVNNNKLSVENYEVSSGDIVQFGVDVVENNRKVTHGCIIASLKLYLPDGKEAKASPSVNEGDRHGMVPLDDLYKLNQILQEANQREQCLESKLTALQHVVEETKKSAEESWQAYVGEERLLSRLSALETKLQQTSKNWSEDRLKDEISKLRISNEQYQETAKATLEKVHTEKLEAVSLAVEQERARISAEQDALLAREQLGQAQLDLQEVAQKLSEIQTRSEEEKHQHQKQIRELEIHMEEQEAKVAELEAKIYKLTVQMVFDQNEKERPELIYEDDMKLKEEILAENEMSESILNKSNSNGFQPNHINLVVAPVDENCEEEKTEELQYESVTKTNNDENKSREKEETRRVSFKLPGDVPEEESENDFKSPKELEESLEKHVDSKTLKYQYQSAQKEQNELRRKIEFLESLSLANKLKIDELDQALNQEKDLSGQRLIENEKLKDELVLLQQKLKESCMENQQLRDRLGDMLVKKENAEDGNKVDSKEVDILELKEHYARSRDEKLNLEQELLKMRTEYNLLRDSMYNKCFFYVAPLVVIILYFYVSAWIS